MLKIKEKNIPQKYKILQSPKNKVNLKPDYFEQYKIHEQKFIKYNLVKFLESKDLTYWRKYQNYSLLGMAILEQDFDFLGYLLFQQACDPNIAYEHGTSYYSIEQIMLNIAMDPDDSNKVAKNYRMLELLLIMHADVNLYKSYEPLLLAVHLKQYDIIMLLLKYKANPYSSIILCISKLIHAKLEPSEHHLWEEISRLFKFHHGVLFRGMQERLAKEYIYISHQEVLTISEVSSDIDYVRQVSSVLIEQNKKNVTILWDQAKLTEKKPLDESILSLSEKENIKRKPEALLLK